MSTYVIREQKYLADYADAQKAVIAVDYLFQQGRTLDALGSLYSICTNKTARKAVKAVAMECLDASMEDDSDIVQKIIDGIKWICKKICDMISWIIEKIRRGLTWLGRKLTGKKDKPKEEPKQSPANDQSKPSAQTTESETKEQPVSTPVTSVRLNLPSVASLEKVDEMLADLISTDMHDPVPADQLRRKFVDTIKGAAKLLKTREEIVYDEEALHDYMGRCTDLLTKIERQAKRAADIKTGGNDAINSVEWGKKDQRNLNKAREILGVYEKVERELLGLAATMGSIVNEIYNNGLAKLG